MKKTLLIIFLTLLIGTFSICNGGQLCLSPIERVYQFIFLQKNNVESLIKETEDEDQKLIYQGRFEAYSEILEYVFMFIPG